VSSERLDVAVDGDLLEGWKDLRVSRSFDRLAGSFGITIADLEPTDPAARNLRRGDVVTLTIDGELVVTARIGTRTKTYDGGSNSIQLTGRDLVADLVDCSSTVEPGTWRGARLAHIAREIVEPFDGITFREDLSVTGLGSAETFSLQTGETAFAALDRLARMRGLVLGSDLAGGVLFKRPGRDRAPVTLARGSNIEGGSITDDETDRFSDYVVNGQGPSPEWWEAGSAAGQSFRGVASDPGISRFRPYVLQAETGGGEAELRERAEFEATVRAARGQRVTYTLPGWTLDGYLWRPGDLVPVFDPILEIGGATGTPRDLLIGAVEWTRSAGSGSRTKLELYDARAFSPEPIEEPDTEGLAFWE